MTCESNSSRRCKIAPRHDSTCGHRDANGTQRSGVASFETCRKRRNFAIMSCPARDAHFGIQQNGWTYVHDPSACDQRQRETQAPSSAMRVVFCMCWQRLLPCCAQFCRTIRVSCQHLRRDVRVFFRGPSFEGACHGDDRVAISRNTTGTPLRLVELKKHCNQPGEVECYGCHVLDRPRQSVELVSIAFVDVHNTVTPTIADRSEGVPHRAAPPQRRTKCRLSQCIFHFFISFFEFFFKKLFFHFLKFFFHFSFFFIFFVFFLSFYIFFIFPFFPFFHFFIFLMFFIFSLVFHFSITRAGECNCLVTTGDVLSFASVTSDFFPAKSTSVLFWSTHCELCRFCLTGVELNSCCSAQRVLCESCPPH